MSRITINDLIYANENGPLAYNEELDELQSVHLTQGSLDGACGQYSMLICLLILGVVSRDEVINSLTYFDLDRRTNLGKLTDRIRDENFFIGTDTDDINDLMDGLFRKSVEVIICEFDDNKRIVKFIEENIDDNNPVMVALDWHKSDGGHWVVVIGKEYSMDPDREKDVLSRFLLLDPSESEFPVCSWNGAIDLSNSKGKYPHNWVGFDENDGQVCFKSAIAFSFAS